jgi:hypothetical protein
MTCTTTKIVASVVTSGTRRRRTMAKCQVELWLDPSDPVPTCELEEGHEGPHRLPEGTEFTDRGNWRELAVHAAAVAGLVKKDPQDFIDFVREGLEEPDLTFAEVCKRGGITVEEARRLGRRL